jgi:peroxiredoxin family protein
MWQGSAAFKENMSWLRRQDETQCYLSEVMMAETAEKEKFTLVLFSGDLDKALAAFILATTAASMGMEVTMFFTFWGLNVIKKNTGDIKSKGWMRKMLNIMNRGGSQRLTLSKFNMMGMGTWMMKN